MTCEELMTAYAAYALGTADEPERAEITRHLAQGCPNCVPGVRHALETVAALSGAVTVAEPPRRLRGRVAGLVAPPPARRWRSLALAPWAIAFALAVALIAVALRKPVAVDSLKLEQALSVLSDPATRAVSFGPTAARGRVFVSPGKGVVFVATGLPPLAPGKTFELWLIPANGNPIPAGTFRGEANSALYVHPGSAEGAAAVAVTAEPAGGSPQPTSTPFVVAKL